MKTAVPASEKQVAFVAKLMAERDYSAAQPENIDAAVARGLSKTEASVLITILLDAPRKPVEGEQPVVEGYYLHDGDVFKVVKAKSTGNLYAKKFTAACPGHLDQTDPSAFDAPFVYCPEPCDKSKVSWDYAPGAMRFLAKAERLTEETAAAMGKRFGSCVVCARTLTDPESVERGIGPVCGARLGA